MTLIKQKITTTFISIIFISSFILLNGVSQTTSQSNIVCSDLEFLKTTSEGIKCSPLPDRTSATYIKQIIETIINPEISAPPLLRPTCAENERYTFKGGSWGCRDRFLLGIEFVGCPAGEYLNRITGGVICSAAAASDISTSFHQHSNYATATHSHSTAFSLQGHVHQQYSLKTHSHTSPICTGSDVLKYTGGFSCKPPTSTLACPEEQLLRSTGSTFECFKPSWTENTIPKASKWSERHAHQVVVLGTDIYVLGGGGSNNSYKNDIWKSTDQGVTWTEVITTGTKWSPRYRHETVVLGTDIYVLGGISGTRSYKNDAWKSTDNGVTWTEIITTGTKWSARYGHQAVVLGTDIYVLGGYDGSPKNDVWKSTDNGVTWSEVITTGTKWSIRTHHEAVVLGADIYVFGASNTRRDFNDIWKSTDKGVTWSEVITTGTKWSIRYSHQVIVLGTDIYVLGGKSGTRSYKNDIWKSTDNGVTWTNVITTGTKWSRRSNHQAVVLGTGIYMFGGYDGSEKKDIWKSTDQGVTWTEVITPEAIWSGRQNHQAVVLGTDIYVLGGLDGSYKNDVWKSIDNGVTWTEAITTGTKWSRRANHQAVVLGADIYVFGGAVSNNSYKNDIWKSTDNGVTWTEVITVGTKWSGRKNYQVIVLGTDIYVLGGLDGSYKNDVWKSIDNGVTWTEVITTGTKWSERHTHQAVVLGTDIYVLGGGIPSRYWWRPSSYKNDIWKSTDNGVTWTEVITTGTKWSARFSHQAVVLGTDIYVLGGHDGSNKNDIWKSTDNGVTWTEVITTGTKWSARPDHKAVVLGTNIYVLGGYNRQNDVWKYGPVFTHSSP